MTLAPGSRLGPYEIVSPLGAGGMGEVYKARDTRLDRTVAVKVLPAHLSDSPAVRQRFEREAKTISQLSHPHICAIYDVGREGETEYLVMEYTEGQTLADRLARGPLPLDQTLRCGVEIADALDRAHRQGIVHRDLKPANVMLTRSGVKLLDFGLAKAMETSPVSGLTALPTAVGSPALTEEGTILGTFQYMAPEQLEGREADARTDIFAFGAVLYEMAAGRKAFAATSQASLISAIMSSDPPPLASLQPMTPPALDRVVRTCLAKNPDDRWQSATDLKGELKWIGEGSSSGTPVAVRSRRAGRERIAWIAAGVFAAAAAALLAREVLRPKPVRRPTRFQVAAPPAEAFSATLALSPDGRSIAFTTSGANPSLYIHSFDSGESRAVPFTTEAKYPFWSPDGKSVAFFAQGVLKRVDVAGGPAQVLCEAADPRGGTWSAEGVIVFSPSAVSGLYRIPASPGGSSTPLTQLDGARQENSHRWPSFLPDGRRYLFMVMAGGSETRGLYLGELGSPKRKKLLADMTSAAYSEEHLVFRRQNALLAQAFDAKRGELTGEPLSVAVSARGDSAISGLGAFTAAGGGALAYRAGTVDPTSASWMDRKGTVLETIPDSNNMVEPASPPTGSGWPGTAPTRTPAPTTSGSRIWRAARAPGSPLTPRTR